MAEKTTPAPTEATSRREQRRRLRQDVGRTQLLDAAEEVFGEFGFHDTTLKSIAERAEFSVGSVYSFFENKEDLFLSVLVRRGEEFLPGMRAAVDDGVDARDQLHRLIDFEVGFFRRHPHFGRLYLRSASITLPVLEVPMSPTLSENFQAAMELQADLFARGQREGTFRSGDPVVLARLFSGLVSGYQALDPAVVLGDSDAPERLPLADLHAVIEAAFAASAPAR
jgi:AcrR family transcriptional regulator